MDGAVVVLYNPEKEDFSNIMSYVGKVDVIYIIDNSAENNARKIREVVPIDDKSIIYRHFPENLGLCKGMNVGINELVKCGCKWAFTMNSDSYFKNDVVKVFRDYVNSHDCRRIAILAPVYTFDRHKASTYNGTRELKRAMMSGNYLNIDVFKKMGGFLEELFVDGLDNEYCIRLRKRKYKIIECGNALMEHMPCQTRTKTILGKKFLYGYDSPKRYYGHARALAFIVSRYKTLYEFGFYWYKLFKIIILFDNKKEYIKQYILGTKDGIRAEKESRKRRL